MITDRDIELMIADCRLTTSPEQEQRVLEDAGKVLKESLSPSPPQFLFRKIGLRLAVVASLAALILVAFLLRETPQTVAWADVQQKVAEQEWIHIVWNVKIGESVESWTSIPLQIEATRFETPSGALHLRLVDFKNGIQEQYDPEQHTVARSRRIFEIQRQSFQSSEAMSGLFTAVMKGDKSVNVKLPDTDILSQDSREIERNGKKWSEFELKVRHRKEPDVTSRMVFLIEPETRLIRSMQVFNGKEQATAVFSYPETGPKSVYDIGAPKTAKFIDLIPQTEIIRLIDGVRKSAQRFGPYIALNVMQDVDAPWYVGTPSKVWVDGAKMRMEYGFVDPQMDSFQKPEANFDQELWWSKRWEQLWHLVVDVSDGKKKYSNIAHPKDWGAADKSHPMTQSQKNWPAPEWQTSNTDDWPLAGSAMFLAYHPNTSLDGRERAESTLDLNPANGPKGTVLLTYTNESDDPEFAFTERFWIDPKRSHIVMKYELISGPMPGTSRFAVTIKQLAKSPRGLWYPTFVSHKSVFEQDGETIEQEAITRHYLDFDTEFPDGVFEPKELPDSR